MRYRSFIDEPVNCQIAHAAWLERAGWRRPLAEVEVIAKRERMDAENAESKIRRDWEFAEIDARHAARAAKVVEMETEAAPEVQEKRRWFGFGGRR